jgi:hypothetical protein
LRPFAASLDSQKYYGINHPYLNMVQVSWLCNAVKPLLRILQNHKSQRTVLLVAQG